MIGLLIVTHETLGLAYTQLAEHIFGTVPATTAILGVRHDDEPEVLRSRVKDLAAQLDSGQGVLVLTDLFGATPCNAARAIINSKNIIMITGLNAPMMVKAIQYAQTSEDLAALANDVEQAAVNGILKITYDDVSEK